MVAGGDDDEKNLIRELKELNISQRIVISELQEIRRHLDRIYREMRDPALREFRQKVLEFIERADLIALRETEGKPE